MGRCRGSDLSGSADVQSRAAMDLSKMDSYRMDGNVAVIEVNNPPVNAMRCDTVVQFENVTR